MINADSFMYGTHNMLTEFGIMVNSYDVLMPKLRERKITLPRRSGSYDLGAKYYDERILEMSCDSIKGMTRADLRELSYVLSKKAKIVMGDEQDKYYIGRIYDPSQIDHISVIGHKFDLSFVCEPFAYAEESTITDEFSLTRDENGIGITPSETYYNGTVEAPSKIVITNNGSQAINGIKIRIRERRDA